MTRDYRKKPVVIQAVQFTKDNTEECCRFIGVGDILSCSPGERIEIKTLEGPLGASVGDWIIRGVKGEYYPCKPDVFELTYEAATLNEMTRAYVVKLTDPTGKPVVGIDAQTIREWLEDCHTKGLKVEVSEKELTLAARQSFGHNQRL